uniref:RING-type E3 ubiquitin transferase n=1 Tax=Oryza brachyantha TaxID=4533 RepID=J3LE17_ORYBR
MRRRVLSLRLLLVVVVLLLVVVGGGFDVANAQSSPPPQPATRTVSRTVSTVITVAIGVFFVLVFICVLVNQCCDCSTGAAGGQGQSVLRRRRGLDPAAVAAIPVVPYAEVRKHRSGGLECAVCLTAFDDADDLRLLPRCSHAFHPDCIDPWLEGHLEIRH